MNIFLVGGAVRDGLLGLPIKDRDYVVVGSTAAKMESLGFKPVGKDFPVFLHPQTKEEYALARTERKSGQGYKGFTFYAEEDVPLEEDLARRDLTINAMAQDEQGKIIDPYGGLTDLEDRVLRHVRAQSFMEDPVRILRLARFAARYPSFEIATETMQLVKSMVNNGEVNHLVSERVWQELSKGLMEKTPQRMFEVLHECGALKVLMPELDCLWGIPQPEKHHPEKDSGIHTMMVLSQAAQINAPLEVRFAALLHDLGKGLTPKEAWPTHHDHEKLGLNAIEDVCNRFKVPAACRDLAVMVGREHTRVHKALELTNSSIVKLMMRVDAIRRPERFTHFLIACECDARGRSGFEDRPYPQLEFLTEALRLINEVDSGAIADQCKDKSCIGSQIHAARVRSLNSLDVTQFKEISEPRCYPKE